MNQLLVPLFVVTLATLGVGAVFLLLMVAIAGADANQRRAWRLWLRRHFCRVFFNCFGRA